MTREPAPAVLDRLTEGTGCCDCCAAPCHAPASVPAECVTLCRALGTAIRLDMVRLLAERGRLCAGEFTGRYDVSQPTISHHLRVLRQAGLVTAERCGTHVYYALDRKKLAMLSAWLP